MSSTAAKSKPTLNPALRDFWATKARNKVLYGGRSSSKTWDAAGFAIFLSQKYKLKFLCTRQFQNKIAESVYTVLKLQIERFGLTPQFHITNNRITHRKTGSEFIFYGLWKNIDEIKSLEDVDVCWVEEAHNLTKEQFDILEPTIRKEGSEMWIIFNPRRRTDFVYKNFVLKADPDTIKRKINYDENPFLSETMRKVIEAKKAESLEDYQHIYLGKPKNEEVNSLFDYESVRIAMHYDDNTVVDTSGAFTYSLDVARFGDDSSQLGKKKGRHSYEMLGRHGYSTTELTTFVAHEFHREPVQPDAIFVDVIGLGAGVYDQLRQLGLPAIEANGTFKPDDPIYHNKRAEMYFRLAEYVKTGGKLPHDEELAEELISTTYTFAKSTDKLKIIDKEEIKDELGRSPDKADAQALQHFTKIVPKVSEEVRNALSELEEVAW